MASPERIRLGLIVNPIAGMGGKVALKGTDGEQVLSEARRRGAEPEANAKAARALGPLLSHAGNICVLTASGDMGQSLCERLGLPYEVAYQTPEAVTTAAGTVSAAHALAEASVALLLFAGGDGTARNICQAVGESVPVLGIPAGVKIQSAVFALTPEDAGAVAATVADGTAMTYSRREVVDLDEDAYRTGRVSAKLYGVMRIPDSPDRLQSMKQSGFSTEEGQMEAIAAYLDDKLEDDVYYAVGSGSCAKCLSRRLGLDYELLGVDVIRNRKLLAKDVTEEQLWQFAKDGGLRILVSPIGGQGFLFGRGNHQFSARVLHAVGKAGITVCAPESKLLSIADHTLRVDCGDEQTNQELHGYYKILCGYGYFAALPCR